MTFKNSEANSSQGKISLSNQLNQHSKSNTIHLTQTALNMDMASK
jgi:hypothetical protein